MQAMPDWPALHDEALALLRQYLRIDTTNPPGNEDRGTAFLAGVLAEAGVEATVLSSAPGRASLVARLPGRVGRSGSPPAPGRALALLNHIDVVPVDPAGWTVDPFGAEVRDGCVWGRGAIDMKGMGVMQLVTVLALAREGTPLERDVLFVAVADEEAGGTHGAAFLTLEHPDLVACAEVLNEGGYGIAHPTLPLMACALSEKALLWLRLRATGTPGHASLPSDDQAVAKLLGALGSLAATPPGVRLSPLVARTLEALRRRGAPRRRRVLDALLGDGTGEGRADRARWLPAVVRRLPPYQRSLFGDVMTVTRLDAGYKENVIPATATASVDCRLLPDTDAAAFLDDVRKRVAEFGVDVEVLLSDHPRGASDGPLLGLLQSVCTDAYPEVAFTPTLCPAFTDSRFFRDLGADAYGLVPVMLREDEVAGFHGNDERIPLDGFLKGCEVVYEITRRACARP